MLTEDFTTEVWASRVRTAVRDGLRIYLYDTKYETLDDVEKFHLMAEEITRRICLSGFWGTPKEKS